MNFSSRLHPRIDRLGSERGAVLVLTALVMLLLLFVAAFATDLGAWYRQGSEQQRAADVGALNGISAYNREVTGQFAALAGVEEWADVTDATTAANLERLALEAAVAQIQALLETSGLTFESEAVYNLAANPNPANPDPTNPAHTSTATLTAVDGTVIVITRGWADIGDTLAGDSTFARFIEVSIEQEGDQFFSGLLREAPTIERRGQSLLSNCGAACTNNVVIPPPFVDFEGEGKGDGYSPLPYDRDSESFGVEEVWAVNHHSADGRGGEIICVTVSTREACDGAPHPLTTAGFETSNRSSDYISPDGKIYFVAQVGTKTGLACFDAEARAYCGTSFAPLFDSSGRSSGPNRINANGPFVLDGDRLFVTNHSGQVGCLTTTLASCGSTVQDVPGRDAVTEWAELTDRNGYVGRGDVIDGKLFVAQQTPSKNIILYCVDVQRNGAVAGCGANPTSVDLDTSNRDNLQGQDSAFVRYDTNAQPIGFCANNVLGQTHRCLGLNGAPTGANPIAGLNDATSRIGVNDNPRNNGWSSEAYSWDGKRIFFAGGQSDLVACWDWETNSRCGGIIDADGRTDFFSGSGYLVTSDSVDPYDFATIGPNCVIGLGHGAQFFSFDPNTFDTCESVPQFVDIEPCACADGGGVRYGTITFPPELQDLVSEIFVTVTDTATGRNIPIDGLDTVPLHEDPHNYLLNLTEVDTTMPSITLEIRTTAILDGDGNPSFTEPLSVALELVSQPTLTR